MAEFDSEMERLEDQFAGLEGSIAGLQSVTSSFRRELEGVEGSMKDAGREASGMSRSVSSSLRRAFDGVVFDGKGISEALSGMGRSVAGSVLDQALGPVQGAVGSIVGKGLQSLMGGMTAFEKGGVISSGRVTAFANGGIVDGPTHFPMRGGAGLMGEAGPEAIVPLTRGSDGKLGVRSSGGGAVHVTMNVSSPDAAGFRRSSTQIAAEMNRAIQRGRRNL